jgi:hypothetical protein
VASARARYIGVVLPCLHWTLKARSGCTRCKRSNLAVELEQTRGEHRAVGLAANSRVEFAAEFASDVALGWRWESAFDLPADTRIAWRQRGRAFMHLYHIPERNQVASRKMLHHDLEGQTEFLGIELQQVAGLLPVGQNGNPG